MELSPAEAQKAVQELLRLPGNSTCADCGAPSPTWASINLGVFVCLECSAHHRAMGTHISKVKSTTLDKWTGQMVDGMRRAGNVKANGYWEKGLPPHFPRPTTSEARGLFIRQKYEQGKFRQEAPVSAAASATSAVAQPAGQQTVARPAPQPAIQQAPTTKVDQMSARRRRAPPSSSTSITAAPSISVSNVSSSVATSSQKTNGNDEQDLLSLDMEEKGPEEKSTDPHLLAMTTAPTAVTPTPVGAASSSFSFLSTSTNATPVPPTTSMFESMTVPTSSPVASNSVASTLSQVDNELDSIAARLQQTALMLDQMQPRPDTMVSIRMNLTSTNMLTLNDAMLDRILKDQNQAKITANALRKAADAIEAAAQQSSFANSIGKLKDELAGDCVKLDAIQMKRIDGLTLGPSPPPQVLEMRRAASTKVSRLVNEAHSLYERATAIVNDQIKSSAPFQQPTAPAGFAFLGMPSGLPPSSATLGSASPSSALPFINKPPPQQQPSSKMSSLPSFLS